MSRRRAATHRSIRLPTVAPTRSPGALRTRRSAAAAGSTATSRAITVGSSSDATSRSTPACKAGEVGRLRHERPVDVGGPDQELTVRQVARRRRVLGRGRGDDDGDGDPEGEADRGEGGTGAGLVPAEVAQRQPGAIGNRDAHRRQRPDRQRADEQHAEDDGHRARHDEQRVGPVHGRLVQRHRRRAPGRRRRPRRSTRPALRSDAPASVGVADRTGPARSGCAPSSGPATTPRRSPPGRRAPCPRRPATTAR